MKLKRINIKIKTGKKGILKDLEIVTFKLTRRANRAANITLVKMWVWTWHISTIKAFKNETLLPLEQMIGDCYKNRNQAFALRVLLKAIHTNNKWNVLPWSASIQSSLQVALTLWRSRSGWGNCSGDNPHLIVSKTGCIASQSSSFGYKKNGKAFARQCGKLFRCYPPFFFSSVFEILRGKRGRSRTQKKTFNFPLGVQKGLDFPGSINYEVFLFSLKSKKEEIKSKPGLLGP